MQFILWGFILLMGLLRITDIRLSDHQLLKRLQIDKEPVSIHYYSYGKYMIRYAEVGNEGKPLIIFVHGAPGSLDAFMDFLDDSTLRKRFRMISVDRPGYGHSGFGRPLTSLEEQAKALLPLVDLNENPARPLLVGHSYGGPIVAKMAMLEPDKIGALQLVGAAVDPGHEKIFWINYILGWAPFHWILPHALYVANEEKLAHVAELKKMIPGWRRIRMPVTIIHGINDGLVPLANAYFAQKMLVNARVTMKIYKNTGHLIPWLEPGDMEKELLKFPGSEQSLIPHPPEHAGSKVIY